MVDGSLAVSFELDRMAPRILAAAESRLTGLVQDEALRRQCLAISDTLMRYLSQAVAVEEPDVVANYVSWACGPGSSNDAMSEVLPVLIGQVRDAADEHLDGSTLGAVAVGLDAAENALQHPIRMREREEIDASTREGRFALQYLGTLLEGDRDAALSVIRSAAEDSIEPAAIIETIIMPVQRTIGSLWHAGEITIADEHFTTATSEIALTMLREWYPKITPTGHRVVISTISGDLHALGARVASDYFEMAGWQSVFLGPNTPSADLLQGVLDYRARVLAMAVTSQLHLRPVAILIRQAKLDAETAGIKIMLGGRAMDQYPGLGERIGADAVVGTSREAPARALELVEGS